MKNLVKKFAKSIAETADKYSDFPERTADFCNNCAVHANNKYGINAANTTEEQNAFIQALDNFFN